MAANPWKVCLQNHGGFQANAHACLWLVNRPSLPVCVLCCLPSEASLKPSKGVSPTCTLNREVSQGGREEGPHRAVKDSLLKLPTVECQPRCSRSSSSRDPHVSQCCPTGWRKQRMVDQQPNDEQARLGWMAGMGMGDTSMGVDSGIHLGPDSIPPPPRSLISRSPRLGLASSNSGPRCSTSGESRRHGDGAEGVAASAGRTRRPRTSGGTSGGSGRRWDAPLPFCHNRRRASLSSSGIAHSHAGILLAATTSLIDEPLQTPRHSPTPLPTKRHLLTIYRITQQDSQSRMVIPWDRIARLVFPAGGPPSQSPSSFLVFSDTVTASFLQPPRCLHVSDHRTARQDPTSSDPRPPAVSTMTNNDASSPSSL